MAELTEYEQELERRVTQLEDAVRGLAHAMRTPKLWRELEPVNRLVVNEVEKGFPVKMHLASGRRNG